MTDEALALAFRSGLPFVGLRDHMPDPDLDRIVPPDAARTARALPLAAQDHRIRLAVAHPDPDLSALNPYLAGHEIDLALAPLEELDAILGPPPPVAEPEPLPDETTEPEALAAAANGAEAESLTAEPTTPPETAEPEPLAAAANGAEADALAAEPTTPPETAEADALAAAANGAEAESLTAEPTAPPETAEPESLAAAANGAEADPLVAEPTAPSETAEPEPVAEASEPEPLTADGESGGGLGEAAAAMAERTAPVDDHPELAGEVPSWLEPPRRGGRMVLTVLIVIVVLAVAVAILIAVANA